MADQHQCPLALQRDKQVTDNVPEVGANNEVYLGDRMLVQRTGEWRECIIPKNDYEGNNWGQIVNKINLIIPP